MPRELLPLASFFRPENGFTSVASALEMRELTGLALSELVTFRPERLALHELLIRVTADFTVPDGSRIGDLGINFRRITGLLLARHVEPRMDVIRDEYSRRRARLVDAVDTVLASTVPQLGSGTPGPEAGTGGPGGAAGSAAAGSMAATHTPGGPQRAPGLFARLMPRSRPGTALPVRAVRDDWGPVQIAALDRAAEAGSAGGPGDAAHVLACQSLARVMAALFKVHGQAWGTRDLIASLAVSLAANVYCGDAIGRLLDPLLRAAAAEEGLGRLPRQPRPVVVNTKGASASGKSTLRPLQKQLVSDMGVNWEDFALISPDIWRKQLLDYSALGPHFKYAGAFTAEEVQIVDQKLDRYMAHKHALGDMPHLLIDRFRFDSFAPDSNEAGSNLLTRFGQMVYLFFVITPPESLVERAWNRGLEFGRYKAVDDTLAHCVEAYKGIPDFFFTWVRRSDKELQFEFLDNTVEFGQRPRTVAYGNNHTCNILHAGRLADIRRYSGIHVDAAEPAQLYPDMAALAPERNTQFLQRCVAEFRCVNLADHASGRIYLRLEAGNVAWVDGRCLAQAIEDPDTLAGIRAAAPFALTAAAPAAAEPAYLDARDLLPTLGDWGTWRGDRA